MEQGYWPVYRFNPAIPGPDGRPTLTDDSPAASTLTLDGLNAFLDGEDRYADIRLVAPADATRLRQKLSDRTRLINIIIRGLSTPSKA